MTDLSPRQNTDQAYTHYLETCAQIEKEEKEFSSRDQPRLVRETKRLRSFMKGSLMGAPLGIGAMLLDNSIDAYQLYPLIYAGTVCAGLFGPLAFTLCADSTEYNISEHERSFCDRRQEAARELLEAAAAEVSSYGLVVLTQDSENQFITTNKGIVTLATDEGDDSKIQLLLDGKVLQPSYHTEMRAMRTLRGDSINAPEVIKV